MAIFRAHLVINYTTQRDIKYSEMLINYKYYMYLKTMRDQSYNLNGEERLGKKAKLRTQTY